VTVVHSCGGRQVSVVQSVATPQRQTAPVVLSPRSQGSLPVASAQPGCGRRVRGALQKKGDAGLIKRWRQRDFVLDAEGSTLSWFEGQTKKGTLQMREVRSVVINSRDPRYMDVTTPDRVYYLYAEQANQIAAWHRHLEAARQAHSQAGRLTTPAYPQAVAVPPAPPQAAVVPPPPLAAPAFAATFHENTTRPSAPAPSAPEVLEQLPPPPPYEAPRPTYEEFHDSSGAPYYVIEDNETRQRRSTWTKPNWSLPNGKV